MARKTDRDRKTLNLKVLNLEMEMESYIFLKSIAKYKGQSMAVYVDDMLKKKIERIQKKASGLIQDGELSC